MVLLKSQLSECYPGTTTYGKQMLSIISQVLKYAGVATGHTKGNNPHGLKKAGIQQE